jgi:hypothetical protein
MLRRSFAPVVLLVLALVGVVSACTSEEGASAKTPAETETADEAELALHMARLQRWTHKTALALQACNPKLADFYLHEMEESIETIQAEAPTYEGYAIADQTEDILVPSVEALDGALDERDWTAVDARLSELARSCNQCHQATDHGFVRIDLEDVPNPYPQAFAPSSE